MAPADPDLPLRQAAVAHARRLVQLYDDLVPLARLRDGFQFEGRRVSFGSFMKGIHRDRARRGEAALTLVTSSKDPYAHSFDQAGALFTYAYRGPIRLAWRRGSGSSSGRRDHSTAVVPGGRAQFPSRSSARGGHRTCPAAKRPTGWSSRTVAAVPSTSTTVACRPAR